MGRPVIIRGIPIVVVLLVSIACSGPQKSAQPSPSTASHPISGAETYAAYCASCHGAEGKGDGPAAPALRVRPPNLTVLAKRKGGRFPEGDIYQVIKWGGGITGHGSKEMPVWGTAFKTASNTDEAEVNARIQALTQYLESIQIR